jgi:hypothetical protein
MSVGYISITRKFGESEEAGRAVEQAIEIMNIRIDAMATAALVGDLNTYEYTGSYSAAKTQAELYENRYVSARPTLRSTFSIESTAREISGGAYAVSGLLLDDLVYGYCTPMRDPITGFRHEPSFDVVLLERQMEERRRLREEREMPVLVEGWPIREEVEASDEMYREDAVSDKITGQEGGQGSQGEVQLPDVLLSVRGVPEVASLESQE